MDIDPVIFIDGLSGLMALFLFGAGMIGIIRAKLELEMPSGFGRVYNFYAVGSSAVYMGIWLVITGLMPLFFLLLKHTDNFPYVEVGPLILDPLASSFWDGSSLFLLFASGIIYLFTIFVFYVISS